MKSMLLIESPALAKVVAGVFEKLGWTVDICNSRDCAMRQVAGSKRYDLILLSDHLPGTNGVQLTSGLYQKSC
jgi:CheY-like chemotaxis protein